MKCPKCGGQCYRRHGVHFDHEFNCANCGFVFDPYELEAEIIDAEIEQLKFNTYRE